MTKEKKTIFIEKKLLDFYKRHGRKHLPWRKRGITPYEVWVSEIMLQQTQVPRVIPYFIKFIRRFPNVRRLARADWSVFLPYYEGLGYYARGRNMLTAAKIIVSNFGGVFPKDKKALLGLPGVGEYTANAILSFGYNKNFLAVDTNLQRVLGRFFFGSKNSLIDAEKISRELHAPKKILNSALMDFASIVCAKTPHCGHCPLRSKCKYVKTRGRLEFRPKKRNTRFPAQDARVYLWLHENHKKYFSQDPDKFHPFVLPCGVVSRNGIKKYFSKNYGLALSVRPPHKRAYFSGAPVLFVNAQILQGWHEFGIFSKSDAEEWKRELSR